MPFPSNIELFTTNPLSNTPLNDANPDLGHAGLHTRVNDILESLQATVGITNDTNPASHDYMIRNIRYSLSTAEFYFDGELGDDNNDGTTPNKAFQTFEGLLNRVLDGKIFASEAVRYIHDQIWGSVTRPRSKQIWNINFYSPIALYFKNKSTTGSRFGLYHFRSECCNIKWG